MFWTLFPSLILELQREKLASWLLRSCVPIKQNGTGNFGIWDVYLPSPQKSKQTLCLVCYGVSKAQNSPGTQQVLCNYLSTDCHRLFISSWPWASFFILFSVSSSIKWALLYLTCGSENYTVTAVSLPAHWLRAAPANISFCLVLPGADSSEMRADCDWVCRPRGCCAFDPA